MCGICGIVSLNKSPVDPRVLENMNAELSNRGPDDAGFYYHNQAGLAHRRLSIIDLKTGHQPMSTQDGRFVLVFNGEIYNYRELRKELVEDGVPLQTQSDAEVLLYLFAKKGVACLKDLNGMFAFAVWDSVTQTLFAARDRMGKKPLYYAFTKNYFIFASELKALIKHPELSKEIDPQALKLFFTFEYIPAPFGIIKDTRKLNQSHYLQLSKKSFKTGRYWNQPEGSTCQDPFPVAKKKIISLLDQATQYRLIADVPVGVFLSGGIDSSAVVAMIAKHREGKNIKTFAINFKERSYDESPYSSLVAKKFGTEHHEETLSADRMLDILPEVARYLDEPFADGSVLPTYLLSQFTRKHVKVALGGDGGDELFAGYPTFFASALAERYQKLPGSIKKSVRFLSKKLPVSDKNMSFDFKARQFLLGTDYGGVLKNQVWLAAVAPQEQGLFFHPDFLQTTQNTNPFDLIQEKMAACPSSLAGDRLSYFYQNFYMCDGILVKVDRASMANSLEVRAPFLDKELVSYVCSLPYHYKLNGLTTKHILKEALLTYLPKTIIRRPKKGFGIPVAGWLKNELRPILLETLNQKTIKQDAFFQWSYVEKLIREHLEGKRNNRKQLFSLLMFHWWKENYLK